MRRLLVLLACATAAAGCGNERQPAFDPTAVEPPGRLELVRFAEAGMSFRAPANWQLSRRRSPALFTLSSGAGFVTGFAYRRAEPLPATAAELRAARGRLVRQVRRRDPRFALAGARVGAVAGARAIELRGRQTLSGRALETRSVHVFRGSVEYVIEAIAPRRDFELVERRVLRPLLRSMRVSGRLRRGGR